MKADIKTSPRCTDCQWVHEADSVSGASFMGVALCPKHAAAPVYDEAARRAEESAFLAIAEIDATVDLTHGATALESRLKEVRAYLVSIRDEARAAIAKAEKK